MNKQFIILLLLCTKNCFAQTFIYDSQNRLTSVLYTDGKSIAYAYDKVGNRVSQQITTAYCPSTIIGYNAKTNNAVSFQWQINTGSGFTDMADGTDYFGVLTDSLMILNPPTNHRGYQFKCAVTTGSGLVYSNTYILKIKTTWQGVADTAWHNAANWECSLVPDEYVDVVVPAGKSNYPTVSSNAKVYSLEAKQGATITIKAGVNLEIKGQ